MWCWALSPVPRLVAPIAAALGEGPVWWPEDGALWFVDIKGGRLHRHCAQGGAARTVETGGQPSFVLPAHDGRLVVGSNGQVLALHADGSGREVLCDMAMPAHNRTNDATVDLHGRLWFGTMDDAELRATGALYCLDRAQLSCLGGAAVVTNGPAVSRDGATLYHVDSGARTIWRHAIGDGPVLHRSEVFVQLAAADGFPDGVVLDSEDCLWVALWDGWQVRRYAADGRLLLTVDLPCARVTKIAFGGPDLRTAYITTARVGLDAGQLAQQPLAGALFAFDAPVPGCRLPKVQLA